MLKNNFFT